MDDLCFKDAEFAQSRFFVRNLLTKQSRISTQSGGKVEAAQQRDQRLAARLAFFTVLVRETLRFCALQVPAFARIFKELGANVEDYATLADIERFPVTHRHHIWGNPSAYYATGIEVWGIKSTSGTTTEYINQKASRFSSRFCIPYTKEEHEFIQLLDTFNYKPEIEVDAKKRLLLSLRPQSRRITPTHTLPSDQAILIEAPFILDAPRYLTGSGDGIDYIFRLLGTEYDLPGVDRHISAIIALPAFMMRLLEEHAKVRNVDPADFFIRDILCAGYQVSPASIRRMEQIWHAKVSLSYSFTENNGYAYACSHDPSIFHFNQAQYVEVLDIVHLKPLGIGEEGWLATTTIFPFQIAMPLVRYLNGDMVQKCPDQCNCGFVGQSVCFIGRKGQFVKMGNTAIGRKYLGAGDIVAALDAVGGIPQEIHYKMFLESQDIDGIPNITVVIEGPMAPHDRLVAKAEAIETELLRLNPLWGVQIASGELRFRVHLVPPGSCGNFLFLGT